MRVPFLLAGVAALAAVAVLAVPAWSKSSPPQLNSFAVSSVSKNSTGLKLKIAGTINCSAKAHFHVWLWIDEQNSTGALAHALIPASLGKHPTAKQKARAERLSTCTGAAKHWSVKAKAEGTHPAKFAKGAAQACWTVTVSHSRRYALQSSCSNVTVG
jgi:hypothetical protein